MKIYLAAPYSWRDVLREHAHTLRRQGHEVTSRWLLERSALTTDIEPEDNYRKIAEKDVEDINRADAFVLFTVDPKTLIKRGGKHFEAGYAYAKRKPIYVIGPNENIFYFLPDIKHSENFDAFLAGIGPARQTSKGTRVKA